MGQNHSSPHNDRVTAWNDFDGRQSPPTSLSFEPSESYMVSYGIDVQTSSKFSPDKALRAIAVDDAKQIRDVLVQSEMVPRTNAFLYAASENQHLCKMSGMKKTFQDCARKVGPGGLFVFHFSGHGVVRRCKIRRKNEWGLAPVDFDYTWDSYLTADVLSRWLSEAECKAKHLLFSLDCCYAGGVATKFCKFADLPVVGNLYILSACTANEETLVVGALRHSIYTYFLSHAILKLCQAPGDFPLQAVFNECHTCSKAFSSLMVMYDDISDDVTVKCMQPQMTVIDRRSIAVTDGRNRVRADGEINRFQYVVELYERGRPCVWLDDKTLSHINSWILPEGALYELDKRNFLSGRVLEAAICSMMYSIATIEISCDRSQERVRNPNLSIIAFLQVAAALDTFLGDVEIPQTTFFMAWMLYREVLINNGVHLGEFRKLYRRLSKDLDYYPPHLVRSATIVPGYKPAVKRATRKTAVKRPAEERTCTVDRQAHKPAMEGGAPTSRVSCHQHSFLI